jgi:hypothetical protein
VGEIREKDYETHLSHAFVLKTFKRDGGWGKERPRRRFAMTDTDAIERNALGVKDQFSELRDYRTQHKLGCIKDAIDALPSSL